MAVATFKEIQDEAIALRFNENLRTRVKTWINLGYQRVWSARDDWDFRRVGGEDMPTFPTVAGDTSPDISTLVMERPIAVFDDQGNELVYVTEHEWEQVYVPDLVAGNRRGRPDRFTWNKGKLLLFPIPDRAYTMRSSYWRKFCHLDASSGNPSAGFMTDDLDKPIWDVEHAYLLVLEAMLIGATTLAAADVPELTVERDALYNAMVTTHAPDHVPGSLQYGRR